MTMILADLGHIAPDKMIILKIIYSIELTTDSEQMSYVSFPVSTNDAHLPAHHALPFLEIAPTTTTYNTTHHIHDVTATVRASSGIIAVDKAIGASSPQSPSNTFTCAHFIFRSKAEDNQNNILISLPHKTKIDPQSSSSLQSTGIESALPTNFAA